MKYILFLFLFLSPLIEGFSQCDGTAGQVTWSYWQDLPNTYELQELYSSDRFPNGPDGIKTLNSLTTPNNFKEHFGGQVKGYIQVPTTSDVIFNITGNDRVEFFLSTDQNPQNLARIAFIEDGTDIEVHDDAASQTSTTLNLVAGQQYYFELNYVEFAWEDFATVYWKTNFLNGLDPSTSWSIITSEYLSDSCETPCTDRGTPCDDGNAATTNDQADGNCNCIGDPVTSNTCVGERGVLQPYIYENLPTNSLEDMYNAAHYPDAPDRLQPLQDNWFERTLTADGEATNYGTRIQAYISVPETGDYNFNITGSIKNIFYLSSDDTEANKEANSILTHWWTGTFGHVIDASWTAEQTMTVSLEAGKYYYIEFVHKGVTEGSFYGLFWNGPQHTGKVWRRVPNFYFFDYTCETACLKAGVACNDNNAYTANDIWDGNCNCAGTPCSGPGDCDDAAAVYPQFEACEITTKLDNRADDAWLSCAPLSTNPNLSRGEHHWIQYNFGAAHDLTNIHVWNYNVTDATNLGFQEVVIDYSNDGINWQELGTYTWEQATAASDYEGFDLPNIESLTTQYILITSLDPTNTCRGLSKVAFTTFNCPSIQFSNLSNGHNFNSPASPIVNVGVDNNLVNVQQVALYIGDNLVSVDETAPYIWGGTGALANLPTGDYTLQAVTTDVDGVECSETLQITVSESNEDCQTIPLIINPITQTEYRTNQTITSTATISTVTHFFAEQSISLLPGFETELGSNFTAQIVSCGVNPLVEDIASSRTTSSSIDLNSNIQLYPNPVQTDFSIAIQVPTDARIQVRIYDVAGKSMQNLAYDKAVGAGNYTVQLSADALVAGIYYCQVLIGEERHSTSFVKIEL